MARQRWHKGGVSVKAIGKLDQGASKLAPRFPTPKGGRKLQSATHSLCLASVLLLGYNPHRPRQSVLDGGLIRWPADAYPSLFHVPDEWVL
jgi:hypothetical protein